MNVDQGHYRRATDLAGHALHLLDLERKEEAQVAALIALTHATLCGHGRYSPDYTPDLTGFTK